MDFKLTIEMVPKTSWYNSLYNKVSESIWDKIRKETLQKYKNKCGICSSVIKLSCHEIWEYDDKKHIQKLKGFISLCNLCHSIKHIGRTFLLAKEDKINLKSVVNHFMKVNSCNKEEFDKYLETVKDLWKERSKYKWQIDFEEMVIWINK